MHVSMVTGATLGWEVLISLSWRPDYVAFQLTCGLCYSKTCLDSPKQIMLQGQSTKKSNLFIYFKKCAGLFHLS